MRIQILFLIASLLGCSPPQSPEDAYQDFLRSFKEANAIEAQISMKAWYALDEGEPKLVQDTSLNFNVARPCHGQIQFRGRQLRQSEEAYVWEDHWTGFLGVGSSVHGFDGLQKTVWKIGPSFGSTEDNWPDLAPLRAWANIKEQTPSKLVDVLGEDGSRIGFAVDFENFQHRYILDSSGNWIGGQLLPIGQYAELLPRFEIEVLFLSLKKNAEAETYTAQIPKAYRVLSSPPTD